MKYYLWILGCAMNYSDAERISAVLDSIGYERVDDEKKCDLFIVVSCSVRQSAMNRIYGKIADLNKIKSKRLLVTALTGCLLESDRKKLSEKFDIVFDIKEISKLPKLINCHPALDTESIKINHIDSRRSLSRTTIRGGNDKNKKYYSKLKNSDFIGNWKLEIRNYENDYLSVIPNYESHFRAYVPISTGCNNFCSYCAVPYTRGREKSRPMDEILAEVKELVKKGYKEINLLGQNVNSYGNDLGKRNLFVKLIKKIDKIPGDYRVYFYSNHPKDMSDELIEIFPTLKHFPAYIHLPLQAGNDEILRKMNRHYTKKQYLDLVKKIRKAMPNVTLTTDMIVGFPGETSKQFEDTKNVMEKAKFDMAFLAQYSPRPGTASAKLPDDVPKEEKKRRENELQKILEKTTLENNKKLVGQTVRVLIDEEKKGKLYGRTEGYKVVEISSISHPEFISGSEIPKRVRNNNKKSLIGKFVDVKITSAESWKVKGILAS